MRLSRLVARQQHPLRLLIPPPSNDLAACAAHYKWGNGENHDLYVQSGPAYSADASINAMSHELFEAISDPYHTGWIEDGKTAAVGEIGDLCNGNFDPFWARAGNTGPPILASDQAQDGTITLGGQNYVIQKEWSNEDGGCTTATAEPGDFPEIPTVTATTADGKSYAFGTWTNEANPVGVQPHGADAAHGLGLDRLAVSFDGRTPTPDDFTVDDFGIDVTGNEILCHQSRHDHGLRHGPQLRGSVGGVRPCRRDAGLHAARYRLQRAGSGRADRLVQHHR